MFLSDTHPRHLACMLQRLRAFISLYLDPCTLLPFKAFQGPPSQVHVGRGTWEKGADARISVATLCIIVFDDFNVK